MPRPLDSRLGIRSAYSFLYGPRMPRDIAARAASFGASAIAITDRDSLHGVHAAVEAARDAGLRPIIGAELLAGGAGGGSVFAFAQDRGGFGRLCEILTEKKEAAAYDLSAALRHDSRGLVLATSSPRLLEGLARRVPRLYAAVTPRSVVCVRPARSLGLPLAFLDDATFLDSDDSSVHAVLRAIALGSTVGKLGGRDRADDDERLYPATELERRLGSWTEAFDGTEEIAASCDFEKVFDGYVFPGYPCVDESSPEEELRARVIAGAERRYGELSDAIMGRIDYELEIIEEKGFAPYFLTMDDIVAMTSRTCGRGSGAASIVSYSLSITNVDPIAYNLYFERFLNRARPDPPDVDVDFAWDERGELIRRVIERFGSDRCARVANHSFFRPRSALREAAKAYGLTDAEVSAVERSLFDLGEADALVDPHWKEIVAVARRLEGLPRGLSMHCGGLVIAPGPIRRYAPVERSAEGFPLLAWEKEGTEAAGLVKIDLLGNRSLAVIRDALVNLEEEGLIIDRDLWRPDEDRPTVEALARGDSMGVFYIESPAMRQLQKKTGMGDFDHIVIHSSIIRPAANKFISEYVRRLKDDLKGERHWQPLHPLLDRILDETYGILCYQEDVSKAAVALAGFDEASADQLRKVIAKKAGGAKLAAHEERFFAGCRAKGVDNETARKVWEMMLSFDGYSFCKPHSASYAMVSFQSAYLRVHHPAEFMAGVLSNQGGYYRPGAYINEARRMGLQVVGPDVNASRLRYHGESAGGGARLVVGLMAIARLSLKGAETLVAERERSGPYRDIAELARRLRPTRDDAVALAAAGVLDSLSQGESRAAQARALLGATSGAGRGDDAGQGSLFGPPVRARHLPRGAAPSAAISTTRRAEAELREEYAALGFLRDRHPFALWERKLSSLERLRASELPGHVGELVRLLGWPVTQKEVLTKDGLEMDFVSFEDETALYETVLFPEAYAEGRRLLLDQEPLLVVGTVAEDLGAITVVVEALVRA